MSSIQHKLLNLETPPPEGVWQRIAGELEDAGSGFQFPDKLKELVIAAPAGVWGMIERSLDQEALVGSAAEKLYTAEAAPPAAAWKNIATTLDSTGKETGSTHRRVLPFWKYAAAAAIIGFLALGSLQLFNTGKIDRNTAAGDKPIPTIEALTHATAGIDLATDEVGNSANTSMDDQEARNDAALEASKKTYAKLNITAARKADIAAAFRFDDYISADDINIHSSSGYEEALSPGENRTGRYIVLMTPDGHFIRVSKKLGSLLCCVSGEEQDKDCRSMVDTWRKQLACSDASHPGNFMDILSLVSSLQEK